MFVLYAGLAGQFVVRMVLFAVLAQQFGIVPFAHLYSLFFICGRLSTVPEDLVRACVRVRAWVWVEHIRAAGVESHSACVSCWGRCIL